MATEEDEFMKFLTSFHNGDIPPLVKRLAEDLAPNPIPIHVYDTKLKQHQASISLSLRLGRIASSIEEEYKHACQKAPLFSQLTVEEFYEWSVTGQSKLGSLELHKPFFTSECIQQ